MLEDGKVYLGTSRHPDDRPNKGEHLLLKLANRHGLITGATGTGKTVTLQIIAEGLSLAGVPVFAADVKGDLSGIGAAGEAKDVLRKRAAEIGFADEYRLEAAPAVFYDLFGDSGHPIRTTVTEMGPLLLSRLMDLNPTQEGVLNIAFKVADEEGLLILDLKDLQALLADLAGRAQEISGTYGNVSKASVGAIQRSLLVLEGQGGDRFFGEPAFDVMDLMRTAHDGRGIVSVLAADRLMRSPRLYATFLLWLLSELFEELPEVGDPEKPRLVFFFDEAHLLFSEAPKALVDKVEQVVKLIRSKGVGVYFVTQNPLDVPDSVLSQLGNRVQHALRAYTPRDQKAVRVAAETFRPNPAFDTETAITGLGVGEALVSTLGDKGAPSMVERTLIRPPSSRLGPITPEERAAAIAASPVFGLYDETVDRESAFEILRGRAETLARREAEAEQEAEEERRRLEEERLAEAERKALERAGRDEERMEMRRRQQEERQAREEARAAERRAHELEKRAAAEAREEARAREADTGGFSIPGFGAGPRRRSSNRQTVAEAAMKSVVRSVGSSLGRALVRGILGSVRRR